MRSFSVIERCLIFFPKIIICCSLLEETPFIFIHLRILVNSSWILPVFFSVWHMCSISSAEHLRLLSEWLSLKASTGSHFLRPFLNFLTLLRLTLLHCKFLKRFSDGIISEMMEKNLPFGVRQRNQRSNCQHPLDHWKSKRVPEKHLLLLYWLCQSLWLCRSQQTVENSERDGNTGPPDLPLEKLYAGQEATVRTGHETTD